MIDMGCFDTVASGIGFSKDGRHGWVASPYPEVAEGQALSLGLTEGEVCSAQSRFSGRSPYPRVVEDQFSLGIK